MIIPMLCVTIFVILVVWFLLPRVARLMIHTPTAISIFVCLSMVQLMAVFISMRCTLCGHFLQVALTLILVVVPEHGTMFTLALVRFPPTATKEIQYLNAKGALTYTDIAGDPVLYGNLPPREISMKDVFRSGDSSKKLKIAEGQWYRYAPSYVSPAYHLLEGRSEERRVGKECRITGSPSY